MKFLILLVGIVIISGCIGQRPAVSENATQLCIERCQSAIAGGQNLTNGSCLSNEIVKDWVCDVAHSPRQPVDNLQENQCPAYGKTASHFVEIDPSCKFIRAV